MFSQFCANMIFITDEFLNCTEKYHQFIPVTLTGVENSYSVRVFLGGYQYQRMKSIRARSFVFYMLRLDCYCPQYVEETHRILVFQDE